MRMQAEFYCISFLLLMGYAYSSDRCERGTLLGNLSYGKILPRSAFTTRFQINLYQCAIECWLRKQRCKSFNYRRIYPSCQLCEEDSMDGRNLHSEHDSIHSNIVTWKNINMGNCSALNCNWTQRCDPFHPSGSACVPSECPLLETRPGVTIDPSNETSLGTQVWQRCELRSMHSAYHITTCLESTAQWSTTNASCEIDYKIVSFGNSSFFIKFHDTKTTFNESVKICQSENAKLLVVTTKQQIDVIKKAFSQKHGWIFTGITDEAKEGTWLAWDGTNITRGDLHWNDNEPKGQTNENCGVIDFDQNESGLLDVSCYNNCSFLCHSN